VRKPTTKRGTRHRRKEQVPSALRFSANDELKIKKFAKLRGASASKSVMELIERALQKAELGIKPAPKSIGPKRRLSGRELMALPPEVRHRRFEFQAKKAAVYYRTVPDLNFQLKDDILET